jgi:uncharacterized heparinase superfamily protein
VTPPAPPPAGAPAAILSRQPRGLTERFYTSGLYRLWLDSGRPRIPVATPRDPIPGEADRANALFQGQFELVGQRLQATNRAPWDLAPPSIEFAVALHGFAWLRDFRAAATSPTARKTARDLIRNWTLRHRNWDPFTWRTDILSRRLWSWLCSADFLLTDADPLFRQDFLTSLHRQSRHLATTARRASPGLTRLEAMSALLIVAIFLSGRRRGIQRAQEALLLEIDGQILPDGGHVSRSPLALLRAFEILVCLRAALAVHRVDVPAALIGAIDRVAPTLRMLRHGDGGFAVFHGGDEGSKGDVETLLRLSDAESKPSNSAPYFGFERLSAGRSLVILDSGPQDARARSAYAGPLALELSIGRDRVVVNCGPWPGEDENWLKASRATAAHSTLVIDDRSASGAPPRNASSEASLRGVATDSYWVEARSDGYANRFGVAHRRRLHLARDGYELVGEDTLDAAKPDGQLPMAQNAVLRFHLHPLVKASPIRNGNEILLALPSGAGWSFEALDGQPQLEDSIYMGHGREARRSQQIVVTVPLDNGTGRTTWRFARIEDSRS